MKKHDLPGYFGVLPRARAIGTLQATGHVRGLLSLFEGWHEQQNMIVPIAAELPTLNVLIANALSTSCWMRLLGTSVTVNANTTLAALLAAEATFAGYSLQQLNAWGTPVQNGDGSYGSTSNYASFTPTGSGGSGNVYGYFLTDSGGATLWGAEAYLTPLVIPQNITFQNRIQYTVLSRY